MSFHYLCYGAAHFFERPDLWRKVVLPILTTLISTTLSLSLLLTFALKPQARLFINRYHVWPWASWLTAVLLVLAEVAIINMIVFLVLFGCVQSQLLRAVLEERGVLPKIRQERNLQELPEACCCVDLTHTVAFLLARLPLMIITLPLHGFPIFGQVAWCFLNGWLYAWELTAEFMVMYEDRHGCGRQWAFVRQRLATYLCFGAGAMGLELIPFLGPWIFFATNACGAGYMLEGVFEETHRKVNGKWELIDLPENAS